jgi:carbonic anhydrase/acetyltransferase-like protein (isoleucine patch superfamily)
LPKANKKPYKKMSEQEKADSLNNSPSGDGSKPLILPVKGVMPTMGNNCFVAPNATIVGDVVMGDECSIWFNTVLRGDVNFIRMGNKVNVQDGAIIHCTYQKTGTTIGNNVSIGHNAIVHGCVIDDNVLVGMGAIVMDNARIGSNSIIAAGSVVLENTVIEPGSIYAGVPAKKVKDISQELIHGEIERIANNYVMYSGWFEDPAPPILPPVGGEGNGEDR